MAPERSGPDRLLRLVRGEFGVRRGHPLPLGAQARGDGVNFSVFSKHATDVSLVLVPARRDRAGARDPAGQPVQPDGRRVARARDRNRSRRRVRLPDGPHPERVPPDPSLRQPTGAARPLRPRPGRPRGLAEGIRRGPSRAARPRTLEGGGRRVRMGPRASPQHPPRRFRDLRDPPARLHGPSFVRGRPTPAPSRGWSRRSPTSRPSE